VLREAARLVFGVDQLSVHLDVEDAVVALDELGLDTNLLLDLGRQTGGLREVVSTVAVLDRDTHVPTSFDRHCSESGLLED
jgi:hypothetical protein